MMSNTVLFFTQLGSIVAFIISLFIVYDKLVNQKEATIQFLKERIDALQKELDKAKENSPDVLLPKLEQRLKIMEEEMGRLSKDKDVSEALIKQRNESMGEIIKQMEELRERIRQAIDK